MGPKPVKPWRFVPLWPLLLAAALGLLWWQRIALVTWLAGFAPLPGDWRITNLVLAGLTLDQLTIEQLDVVQGDPNAVNNADNGEPLTLALKNLVVGYRLFTDNGISVDSVKVGQVRLGMAESKSESGATAGSLLRDIRAVLQQPMPGFHLLAEEVYIENTGQQVLADPLAVSLQSSGDSITATLTYDGQQAVLRMGSRVQSAHPGQQLTPQQIVVLSAVATDSGIRVDAGVDLEKLYAIAADFGLASAIGLDNVHFSGPAGLRLDLQRNGDEVAAEFNFTPINLESANTTASGLRGRGRITVPAGQEPGLPFTVNAADGIHFTANHLQIDDTRTDEINLQLAGRMAVDPQHTEIELANQSRFTIASVRSRLSDSTVQVTGLTMTPDLLVTDRTITLNPGFRIQAGAIRAAETTLNQLLATPATSVTLDRAHQPFLYQPLGNWQIESGADLSAEIAVDARMNVDIVNPDPSRLDIKLVAEPLQFSAPWPLPAIDTATLDIGSEGPIISAQGQIALAPLDNHLDVSFQSDPGRDIMAVRASSSAAESVPALLALMDDYAPDSTTSIAVSEGMAEFAAEVQWISRDNMTDTTVKLDLEARDISGQVDAISFQDLDLNINGGLDTAGNYSGIVDATLDTMDYGLVVREIHSKFRLRQADTGSLPILDVDNLSGILFDSRFHSEPFQLDTNQPDTRVTVRVESLDIARLVEAQGIDHLSATGSVRGVFPVDIDGHGITVVDGNVTSMPGGGQIRYDLSDQQAAALDNPLTDVVITALRDFRYSVLTADTNYYPDGELFINFHLEGISPELDPNRQVNLNINTQQNVLSLLRSLNYSDGLNQSIDQQIQDNMK